MPPIGRTLTSDSAEVAVRVAIVCAQGRPRQPHSTGKCVDFVERVLAGLAAPTLLIMSCAKEECWSDTNVGTQFAPTQVLTTSLDSVRLYAAGFCVDKMWRTVHDAVGANRRSGTSVPVWQTLVSVIASTAGEAESDLMVRSS